MQSVCVLKWVGEGSPPSSPPPRPLRDAGAADAGGAHLCEHLVEPLQGAVEVQLDPAGGAGHRLSPGRAKKQMLSAERKSAKPQTTPLSL